MLLQFWNNRLAFTITNPESRSTMPRTNSYTFRLTKSIMTGAIALCCLIIPSDSYSSTGSSSPLSLNVTSFDYWTTQVPLKNVMGQQPHNWTLGGWPPPPATAKITQYTADGTPLTWDSAYAPFKYVFIHGPGLYPAGPWVLLYDGQGEFALDWDAKNLVKTAEGRYTFSTPIRKDGMVLRLTKSNPQNPVHNIRLVEQKYENDYTLDPWYPEIKNLCNEFSTLRFMCWMGASDDTMMTGSYKDWGAGYSGVKAWTATSVTLDTNASTVTDAYKGFVFSGDGGNRLIVGYNGPTRTATVDPGYTTLPAAGGGYSVLDFPNREWADRPKPGDLAQNSMRGMAVELLVDLCNRTGCAPWFSLPTAASDDYMKQFAVYVRDHLDKKLRIYIEWSNEAWNYTYPGWAWSDAMGRRVGIGGFAGYPAYRMVQIFKIWDDVFGEPHLRTARTASHLQRILSVQCGYVDRAKQVLDFDGTGIAAGYANPIDAGKKACDYADVVAVTNYIGEGVDNVKNFAKLGVSGMVDSLKKEIDGRCAATGKNGSNDWYQQVAMAKQRGLNCVTYECGVSLYNSPYDSATGVALDALETSPRMKELYLYCLTKWKALGVDANGKGAALWNQFGDTQWSLGNSGQWGHWGIRQHLWQPIDSCPKWQALREFAQNNPRWWTDVPMPANAIKSSLNLINHRPIVLLTMANGKVMIQYRVETEASMVKISVQDLKGATIKTLITGTMTSGDHRVVWDGKSGEGKCAGNGVYFLKAVIGDQSLTLRIMLTR
jgi:hypothetical protein